MTQQINTWSLALQLDFSGYGRYLGAALFYDTLHDSFMAAKVVAEANAQPLRVLLVVEDPAAKGTALGAAVYTHR